MTEMGTECQLGTQRFGHAMKLLPLAKRVACFAVKGEQ